MEDLIFQSPLRITVRHEFTGIDFGPVAEAPGVRRLRQELNACLAALAGRLPEPLGAEARDIISGYGGGDFFRLFYTPTWSFLHWARRLLPPVLLQEAQEAHALALFLHLWDDHLTDGQLKPDLLRLQLRTLAWQRYTGLGRSLCLRVGIDPVIVDAHTAEYLQSLHRPEPVADLIAYAERFRRQVAIWTLVPRLLGQAVGGPEFAGALAQVVEEFAVAWRLIDDIQDIDQDLLEGKETAVLLALDDEGRRRWREAACVKPPAWAGLVDAARESGCLRQLLALAADHLRQAASVAAAHGWHGLAGELQQAQRGLACA